MANQVSTVLPSGNFGGQMFLLLQIHTRIMVISLKLLLHHKMFLVLLLVVFICKLVHRLPCLNVPYLRLNVSSYLIFLKKISTSRSGNGTQATHQVASVIAPASSIQPITRSTSSSPSYSSNFSGNQHWIQPNFSQSIFSAQVVDRHAYKSNDWIIDIEAIDHMVQSVSQHTSITSIVQSCIYLPNGEEALVTHIGTMQISSTLTLTRVLCVPSFSFNLISISKLTKNLYCCLFFFFFLKLLFHPRPCSMEHDWSR